MASSSDFRKLPVSKLRSPYDQAPFSVIVVDDEILIADTLAAILNRNQYAAIAAYNAQEALTIAREMVPNFLITDVMMPAMDGIDLALAMERLHPDCKSLLLSGHVNLDHLRLDPRWFQREFPLLSKPLHPDVLLERLATLSIGSQVGSIVPDIFRCGQDIDS